MAIFAKIGLHQVPDEKPRDAGTKFRNLQQNGHLWLYQAGIWTLLDTGTKNIALASDDTLVDLETAGDIWTFRNSWNRLDKQAISFVLSGNTLDVTDANGLKTFIV